MKLHERHARIEACRLDGTARMILVVIGNAMSTDDEDRPVWLSAQTIADRSGFHRGTVVETLTRLESIGVLTTDERIHGAPVRRHIDWSVLAAAERPGSRRGKHERRSRETRRGVSRDTTPATPTPDAAVSCLTTGGVVSYDPGCRESRQGVSFVTTGGSRETRPYPFIHPPSEPPMEPLSDPPSVPARIPDPTEPTANPSEPSPPPEASVPPSTVIIPPEWDNSTRASMEQVLRARADGVPIRTSRSFERICEVSPERARQLYTLWRTIAPLFDRADPEPVHPGNLSGTPVGGAEVAIDRDTRAVEPAPEPTQAPEQTTHGTTEAEPAAEVPDVRLGGDASGTSASVEPAAADRGHLVIREPDHLPSVAGGDPPDVLPGLRPQATVKAAKGRAVKLDEDQWHGAAATLAAIVEGVTQRPAGMMDPTSGRGRQLAEVGTSIGWSRMRARLDAVALAARGQPTLPAAVACWRQIQQDGPGRVSMLLRADGAKLLGDLDAEVEDLAAGRMEVARQAPTKLAATGGARDRMVSGARSELDDFIRQRRSDADTIDILEVKHGQ